MQFRLGHVADVLGTGDQWHPLPVAMLVGFAAILLIEHLAVKHGRRQLGRGMRTSCAALLTISLSAVVAAPAGAAQFPEPLAGLPDLISDAPYIWITRDIEFGDGEVHRVMAFDGFLHNIGDGMLDLYGNPQIPGGVKQRVFDGENWNDVSTPTVRYETDDGHNHFHLIAAVEYALWDDGRTKEIDPASKVGFCLVDTEQMEDRLDSFYDINRFDYCNADDPESTELRMGISPGWRDTYESTTTLQWVDISDVEPGRYWVTAITDPNDEIVESDEDNNGLVFSQNKFAVPGYVARELPAQSSGDPIVLKARVYGTVGDLAFVIVDPPEHGRLDIPDGVDVFDPTVHYQPDEGFTGTDEFTYYAHDTEGMFPLGPEVVTVTIAVQDAGAAPLAESGAPALITEPGAPVEATRFEPVAVPFAADEAEGSVWFAGGLPPGLRIDSVTGEVTGTPTTAGDFDSTIVARSDDHEIRQPVAWQVAPAPAIPRLARLNDFETSTDQDLRIFAGSGNVGSNYEASGLPTGTRVVENVPLIVGRPEQTGRFEVEIREILDGEVVDTTEFVWTVRPAAIPVFVV